MGYSADRLRYSADVTITAGLGRQGLARGVMAAVGTIARENRMPAIYLQVSEDNDAAIAMYEALGFTVHHEYTYLVQPST